jgi:glycosyltransferase involved in cell wall biosynthesis
VRVAIDVSAVPAQPVGAGVYVLRLVEALAASREVELDLVARRDDGVRWATLAGGARVWAEAPTRRPVRLAWEQAAGPRLARRLGPDVWHGPHYTMPLRVRPAVVTIHDLTFFDHPEWHERGKVPYFRSMIRASAARAAGLVCVSRYTAERLAAVVRPRVPVAVVPHGFDHERFSPGPDPGDADRLAVLGVRPPFVAFVGTLEPRKGVPALVRAVDRLALTHPDLQLILAGRPGWGVDEVEAALADAPALTGRVLRTGYVDDPTRTALLRGAAVVAYPSLDEGFGLPVLEALAVGAAVVTTTGSAMAEVAGDAAVLVPPGDEAALAGALEAVLAGGPEVDRLREAGPRTAAPYTWEASAAGHVKAYLEALGA